MQLLETKTLIKKEKRRRKNSKCVNIKIIFKIKSWALKPVVWECGVTLLLNEKRKKNNESVLKHYQTNLFTFLFGRHSSNCPWVSVKLSERNLHLCVSSPSSLPVISHFLLLISRPVSSFPLFFQRCVRWPSSFWRRRPSPLFCLLPFSILGFSLSLSQLFTLC